MCRLLVDYYFILFIVIGDYFRTASGLLSSAETSQCAHVVAPKSCPNEDIKYYLYTSEHPSSPVELNIKHPVSISKASFVQGPIKFLIHGYTGNRDYTPNSQKARPINVISIDYGPLVPEGCYVEAVENTDVVANCTAQFLEHLLTLRQDIELPSIHFIALSLGAQVAGQISTYFTMGQIERISALDAALPLYSGILRPDMDRINKSDAKFIDALHTNAGIKGKLLPYADIDFYANGGTIQPPCSIIDTTCSHEFSAVLFAESINSPNGFWGHSCSYYTYFLGYCADSDHPWELFGEYVDPEARGTYFFDTNDTPPYARGANNE